ncbi:hypothetical protein BT96DRAFT_1000044 [Gymnopus androsaceus JB14]|uniref:PSD13 N-terminal domain-containing protein n=1 Tax=Gymnopus androsaceus JB14 TaxID=1447944 RepID=A0A6A4H4U9_9AGAR|nr:hypothetical protein BT96DRAFT_1000044 [Gymnopus androsaceus JB14]
MFFSTPISLTQSYFMAIWMEQKLIWTRHGGSSMAVTHGSRVLRAVLMLRHKAEYAPYYRNSLLYLACVDPALDMMAEERLARTHDLLMHPILDALDGTPFEWIKRLLFTFNESSIGKFEALAPLLPEEVGFFYLPYL